ncbi:MAG: hypothetical protein IM516_01110 [Pseudanabaena sp. M158S2SP1A06QC]|nr:hypothetical protein [Pseudanabaena sp. M158S2SP1A06QC]MCA6623269.1 hypothetical protein [Pseudanabaena sp. M165S2SP1A06QC]
MNSRFVLQAIFSSLRQITGSPKKEKIFCGKDVFSAHTYLFSNTKLQTLKELVINSSIYDFAQPTLAERSRSNTKSVEPFFSSSP